MIPGNPADRTRRVSPPLPAGRDTGQARTLAQGSRVYSALQPPDQHSSETCNELRHKRRDVELSSPGGQHRRGPVRREPLSQRRGAAAALAPGPASLPEDAVAPLGRQVALQPRPSRSGRRAGWSSPLRVPLAKGRPGCCGARVAQATGSRRRREPAGPDAGGLIRFFFSFFFCFQEKPQGYIFA